jgi:hypothetical protein
MSKTRAKRVLLCIRKSDKRIKKMIPKFIGIVEKGKLVLTNQEAYENYLKTLVGEIQLTVSKVRKPRSNQENAYYWAVIIEILRNELGYTPDEMHEALKWKFLKIHEGKIPTVRSTSDLSTVEFEAYMTQIREWASIDMNIYIPEPNEVNYNE